MHSSTLTVVLVAIFTVLTFGSPIPRQDTDLQGLALRGAEAANSTAALNPRGGKLQPPICNVQGWPAAEQGDIATGIRDIQKKGGRLQLGPKTNGHPVCRQIACSNGKVGVPHSSILVCNDNHYEINPDLRYLSSYAVDIINHCTNWHGNGRYNVQGQLFDSDGYNVIVRAVDRC